MNSITVAEKTISLKIPSEERIAVVQDIKYPVFSSENKEKNALCKKMNKFYFDVAHKYSSFGQKKPVKASAKVQNENITPAVMTMKCTVSFCGECIVSVVQDLSFSKGKSIKMRRFSQMWSVKENCLLSVSDVLNLSMENKKRLWEIVVKNLSAEAGKKKNRYFPDFEIRAKKHFCFNNSFAAPAGMVFFFDAGVLRDEKYGASGFVVPYRLLKNVLRKEFQVLYENEKGDL